MHEVHALRVLSPARRSVRPILTYTLHAISRTQVQSKPDARVKDSDWL